MGPVLILIVALSGVLVSKCVWVWGGGYRQAVVVDEHQADTHDHIGYERERSQVLQAAGKHEADDEGEEDEHVDARVESGNDHGGLVGVTVPGGPVGSLDHLSEEELWKGFY